MSNEPNLKHAVIVWWMIWAALLNGLFIVYFVVEVPANAAPMTPASVDSPMWMAGFAPFVVSVMVRWMVLPRVQIARTAFAVFVVGMAMAEVSSLLGVVVFPAYKLELFVLSVLGIVEFAPYFASRFVGAEPG